MQYDTLVHSLPDHLPLEYRQGCRTEVTRNKPMKDRLHKTRPLGVQRNGGQWRGALLLLVGSIQVSLDTMISPALQHSALPPEQEKSNAPVHLIYEFPRVDEDRTPSTEFLTAALWMSLYRETKTHLCPAFPLHPFESFSLSFPFGNELLVTHLASSFLFHSREVTSL